MTSLTVVTPWHNCHELAPAYWRAISVLADADRIIVVDNASEPPLEHPGIRGAIVHRVDTNLGFSKACNVAFDLVKTDAVCFLNNDIRMVSATWADNIRQALQPGTLVGAHLRADPHTAVDDGKPIPYLDGWCLAIMRDDLHAIGGWDELEEPSYWGDNILCVRATAAGMRLAEVPVGLTHIGNYTSRRIQARDDLSALNRGRYEQVVRESRQTA